MCKIGIIGAGSGCFCLSLIKDLCFSKLKDGCVISLMDIDKTRLDEVFNIATQLVAEIGANIKVEKTLDRIECIKNSDFVINTALAAPHERLRQGWEIAMTHGFKFGGGYHIMYDEPFWVNFYQLKLFESITEDMLVHCPDAWHLMVANPVFAGCTHVMRKYPKAKVVGLCHGYGMAKGLPGKLGIGYTDMTYELPGVNHFVWLTRAYADGIDLFDALDKWLVEKGEEHWEKIGVSDPFDIVGRKRMDFYKKHGVIGIGDTLSWTGASWPWWYHSDEEVERFYGEDDQMKGWNSYFEMLDHNADLIKRFSQMAQEKESLRAEMEKFGTDDLIVPLIESIHCDIPQVLIVNIANKGGLVPGLPEDFAVEVPAFCSKRGINGIQTTPLPRSMLAHILRDRIAPVEMELAAYNERKKSHLQELVLMDKWSVSLRQAESFVDDSLNMPCHEEMRGYYK